MTNTMLFLFQVKHSTPTAAKTPAGTASKDGDTASHVTHSGSARMPLSPLRVSTMSPKKAAAQGEISTTKVEGLC